ncbi:asialoglycoprotein receptor 1 isoform X2 [Monodon monoceros]|uniref:asialoglycoprotein receptor 1 isoform X2 n=1 Tax=Monodon monoceros TaxID=40151 RepID=UPI0010F53393|nr:asialoglycoprotein receptor 1 isoform X2 [Monodon monoceros]XP_029067795.1 asialoglycoprotein receptor 1 isoform X2 [Monodon monoceros]XP_029067805.1 asialoglycoprotein receptor 1 isoform X2 [Monodon monoceros]
MTKEYQDLQHLDNEENDHQHRKRPPPPHSLFRRLCSGPSLMLISIGLSLLLLVVVCVIGSQNSKLQEELRALRETFSNLTVSTEAKVKALSVQGGNVGRKMKSLESQLEKQQQDLSEDHSSLLLHVKQFVSDLRSLSCQMAVLQGNGSERTCCPVNWVDFEGKCYWFSRSGKPWPEAEKYCQLEDAHLVVVGSWEEQVRARRGTAGRLAGLRRDHQPLLSPQKFIQHHMGPVNTWMGLTDQNGPWKWVDGTDYESGFKNWRPEQPDDWYGHGLGGGEDCAHFTDDGRWNDDVCQRPYRTLAASVLLLYCSQHMNSITCSKMTAPLQL